MDVAGQHVLGVGQNGPGIVGEDDLHLSARLTDQIGIIVHIVHAGKGVGGVAEQLAVALQREHILVGVHTLFVHHVLINEVIAHLVGGIGQHQDHLLGALGDAAQANSKTVAAEDGEDHANGLSAQLRLYIGGNIVHRGIVTLGAGHNGLSHGDYVAVAYGERAIVDRLQDRPGDDLGQVISAADNGGADTHGYGADHPAHRTTLLL